MNEIVYKVGDLKNIIKESSQEFKPKMGLNVEKDNTSINDKSYKESEKRAKDFDGGLDEKKVDEKLPPKIDGNKTTLDSSFTYEPDKEYKDRIKAQAKGYTSKMEEDNDIEKSGEFEQNSEIYNNFKDAHEEMAGNIKDLKKSGLTASKMPESTFEKDSMYENKTKVKRLYFKHTKFLGEEHMLSRIPEEYKVNGQRIIMKDAVDNEYLIEWKVDKDRNISEAKVLNHTNKTELNEEMSRIRNLFNYKSEDYFNTTNSQSRLNESKKINEFINEVKNIKK